MEPITDLAIWDPARMVERVADGEKRGVIRFERDLNPEQRRLLAEVAVELHLDPLFREITLYEGQLYIEIDGWYRVVRESGRYDGEETFAPTVDDLRMLDAQPGDMVAGVRVHVKGQRVPCTAFGVVTAAERQDGKTRDGRVFRPTTQKYAFRMAEKRAQVQAYRKAGFKVRGVAPALIDELPAEVWEEPAEALPGAALLRCSVCNLAVGVLDGWDGTQGPQQHADCAARVAAAKSDPDPVDLQRAADLAQAELDAMADRVGTPKVPEDDDHDGRLVYYQERIAACQTQEDLLAANKEVQADPNLSGAEKTALRRGIGARSGELAKAAAA